MVERLKDALDKARSMREQAASAATPQTPALRAGDWEALAPIEIAPEVLKRGRVVTPAKSNPAFVAFDVLRTRLVKVCAQNRWTRIGVTSPGKHCGKTFVAANLAFSIARARASRTALLDFDLKRPALAPLLGWRGEAHMLDHLRGAAPLSAALLRHSDMLAFGLNTHPVRDSAEFKVAAATHARLEDMRKALGIGVMLYDLPPMLVSDDVLAFMSNLDAILLVAAAGETRAEEIMESERMIGDGAAFLGVVLNKAEDVDLESYEASYRSEPVST